MARTAAYAIVLGIGLLSSTGGMRAGQSPSASQGTPESPRFRVGVDAVRIDAVVTDQEGRTVPDLTAAEFEVRQNGKLQKVTFAQFMPVLSGPPAPAAEPSKPRLLAARRCPQPRRHS